MGLVDLPTNLPYKLTIHVRKYATPMDTMGMSPTNLWFPSSKNTVALLWPTFQLLLKSKIDNQPPQKKTCFS